MIDNLAQEMRDSVARETSLLEAITMDLIRFRTLRLTGEDFEQCATYLCDQLASAGVDSEVIEIPGARLREFESDGSHYRFLGQEGPLAARFAVLGSMPGSTSGGPSLHLNGHYCVVEPSPGWQSDPFEPVKRGGWIVGRGSSDMKGGLASIIVALRAVRAVLGSPGGDVHVSMTVDTHFGGNLGAGYIATESLGKSDRVIVTDTSGPDTVLLGYRGQLWIEIETAGESSHGSTPEYGHNAVADMAVVLAALDRHASQIRERESSYPIVPESSRRPTLVVGSTIDGGRWMNLVPERCVATLDRRLIPEESASEAFDAIAGEVDKVREASPGMNVRVRKVFEAPPCVTSVEDPLVKTVVESIEEHGFGPAKTMVHPAFLDLRWFTETWGVPGIVYGPGDGGAGSGFRLAPYRGPDESVQIDALLKATTVLATSIGRLTQPQTDSTTSGGGL